MAVEREVLNSMVVLDSTIAQLTKNGEMKLEK